MYIALLYTALKKKHTINFGAKLYELLKFTFLLKTMLPLYHSCIKVKFFFIEIKTFTLFLIVLARELSVQQPKMCKKDWILLVERP